MSPSMFHTTLSALLLAAGSEATAMQPRAASSCNAATTTIGSAADASSLASACPTFTGDVALSTGVTDDIAFDGLQEIQGSLIVVNVTQVTSLSSNSLQTITGDFTLNDLTILSTVNFTELQSVNAINLTAIPALQTLSILETLQNVSSISIMNTQINALQGFSLQTVDSLTISNNPYMESVNLQPYNITGQLIIQANGRDLDVSMPNIQSAQNMTFFNCSSISMPSITQVNGTLRVSSNYITSFNAAPLLQSVNGGLILETNTEMANISLPELRSIAGGFSVVNNTNLTTLDELYSLTSIAGAVELLGDFTNISFPSLTDVRGAFHVESTKAMPCGSFDTLAQNNVIKGTYTCDTASDSANGTQAASTPGTSTSSGTASSSTNSVGNGAQPSESADSSGLSGQTRAGLAYGLGVGGGCLLVIAAIVWFVLRKRRQQRIPQPLPEADGAEIDRAAMLDSEGEKHELEQPAQELPSGPLAQELPAKHGETELGRSTSTMKPPGIESRHEMPANETPLPADVHGEDRNEDGR